MTAPSSDERLLADERLRAMLSLSSRGRGGGVVGVEHEYRVEVGGQRLPFGSLVHTLGLGVRNLHPDDPNAYPLASGALLTSSGLEAEIVLAPIPIAAGFSAVAVRAAESERLDLARLLGAGRTLKGDSTHFSVPAPEDLGDRVAVAFASRFAVPLMLLLDIPASPGLVVRPCAGRTELSGEYVAGPHLAAALIFAAAAVRRCTAMARDQLRSPGDDDRSAATDADEEHCDRLFVPPLKLDVVPAAAGFGWFVDRAAFGCDLHQNGRSTVLHTRDGSAVTAQKVLERSWTYARPLVAGATSAEELGLVDALVAGDLPLPLEGAIEDASVAWLAAPPGGTAQHGSGDGAPGAIASAGDAHHGDWRRPHRRVTVGLELAPVMVTWETVVFLLVDDARRRRTFAVVPRPLLDTWMRMLEEGALDGPLSRYLAHAKGDRALSAHPQALVPGLFDALPSRRALLPPAPDRTPAAFEAA